MVAAEQGFPLVHWAVLVCSFDDFGTQVHARRITPELLPSHSPMKAPSHPVCFKYKLNSRNSFSLWPFVDWSPSAAGSATSQ
jgi:hypothetical protein